MAEQTSPVEQTEDSQSILARLDAALAPEPEAEPAQTPQAESAADEQPEATDSDQPADDGLVDLDDGEGRVYRVPQKIKEERLRWEDYTQKTQAVKTQAEAAHDALQFAEAKQAILSNLAEDIGKYREVQAQLQQYSQVNWSALDENTRWQFSRQEQALKEQLQQMGAGLQAKAQHLSGAVEAHQKKQWQLAERGVLERLGRSVTQDENLAMAKQAEALGFSDKELKGRFADPRVLHAIYKAAKWDQLQAGKTQAVAKAPPVVKPGATKGSGAAAEAKYRDVRQSLKKSGKVEDAARLFLMRG